MQWKLPIFCQGINVPWSCSEINSLQWNVDLTNLYLTRRFSLLQFSKICGRKPWDNEKLVVVNRFARPLLLCYILVFMVFLVCIHGLSLRLWNICTFFIILFSPSRCCMCLQIRLWWLLKQPFNMSMKHCKRCLFFWTQIFFVKGNHLICLDCQTLSLNHDG